MAVAEVSAVRGFATRWVAGFAVAVAFAAGGAAAWFLVETLLGEVTAIRPFIGVMSIAVGGLAGYGAFLGTGRHRSAMTQAIAVTATLPVLAIAQALVVRLIFVRELETMGYVGATFRLPLSQWWAYVSWALFSTSPPALIFWAMAVGYALAVPRRYRYDRDDDR